MIFIASHQLLPGMRCIVHFLSCSENFNYLVSKWGLTNDLCIVSKAFCGRSTESILVSLISLLHFSTFSSTWEVKFNFESNTIPKCFWLEYLALLLFLNLIGRWKTFAELDLWEKINSFIYLLGLGLSCIFDWSAHLLIFFKSAFKSFKEINSGINT